MKEVTPYLTQGFFLSKFWSQPEHEFLKRSTFAWIYSLLSPWISLSSVDAYPLEEYHVWSQDLGIPHGQLFTAESRHGPLAGRLRDTLINRNVRSALRSLGITSFQCSAGPMDEPEVNPVGFRIVRPRTGDAVHLHAEAWYGEDAASYVNMWVPILGFQEDATLPLVPRSHLRDFPTVDPDAKFMSPRLAPDVLGLEILRPKLSPGEGILFHSKTLHGGAANLSDATRISLELRFIPQ